MSERRYERTSDGKWYSTDAKGRHYCASYTNANLEDAYQLGLQSHPAPTDLLLTDEEIILLTNKVDMSDCKTFQDGALKLYRAVAKAQLSKLQQARPTTERWNKSEIVFAICSTINGSPETCKPSYCPCSFMLPKVDDAADQLIPLFPDEQAIEKRIARKKAVFDAALSYIPKAADRNTLIDLWNGVAPTEPGQMPEETK